MNPNVLVDWSEGLTMLALAVAIWLAVICCFIQFLRGKP